jgi:Domain of unknown function (DUF4864)
MATLLTRLGHDLNVAKLFIHGDHAMQSQSFQVFGISHSRRGLLALALSCLAAPVLAAPGLSADDEKAVRDVVAAQLAAFAADDAKKAFALAATPIQDMFKTPAKFMAMVQSQYPVVYRPATVTYFKPETDGEIITMKVQMTDAKDTPWLAVYALERPKNLGKTKTKGKDATWRIAGCIVTTNVGRTV